MSVISKKALDTSMKGQCKGKPPNVVILNKSQFSSLKKNAGVPDADVVSKLEETMSIKNAKETKAKARREMLVKLENERKSSITPTEMELEEAAKRALLVEESLKKKDDFVVQTFEKMAIEAVTKAARDLQLEAIKQERANRKETDKTLDVEMELERQKAIALLKKKELEQRIATKKSAQVLNVQIAEREEARIQALEQQEEEAQQMMLHYQRLKLEAEERAKQKRETQRLTNKEVADWNALQLAEREKIAKLEKEEEMQLVKFMQEKAKFEKEQEMEKARVQKEKAIVWARMRSQQEKIIDTRAEKDELQARRHYEAKEREWRLRETSEAARRNELKEEMKAANAEFQKMKVEQREAQKLQGEQLKVKLDEQAAKDAEERKAELIKQAEQKKAYAASLELQRANIRKTDEALEKKLAADEFKQMKIAEAEKFARIRQQKLDELRKQGVPEKYLVDIMRAHAK